VPLVDGEGHLKQNNKVGTMSGGGLNSPALGVCTGYQSDATLGLDLAVTDKDSVPIGGPSVDGCQCWNLDFS
jgi:hypothetical protein